MKISEKRREPKKAKKLYFQQPLRKRISSTGSMQNKIVNFRSRGKYFRHGKPQKTKNCGNQKSA